MEVPRPGPLYDQAAWYRYSPTPGEIGPSVIIGHVDSAKRGPSVFFTLGALKPGQRIEVARADGTTAAFGIDSVESFPKNSFPTRAIYGDTDYAALRLITCGGSFDKATGNYRDNIVVFARLVGSVPA
jgi:sortase (surface protein transpeptidase)